MRPEPGADPVKDMGVHMSPNTLFAKKREKNESLQAQYMYTTLVIGSDQIRIQIVLVCEVACSVSHSRNEREG